MSKKKNQRKVTASDFAEEAEGPQMGLLAEFWYFLLHNKKWWLTPIFIVLIVFGYLVVTAGSGGAGAFIYTLF